MYITNKNRATRRLFNATLLNEDGEPLMDGPVEFAKTGTAQVDQDVGEALISHYDSIKRKED